MSVQSESEVFEGLEPVNEAGIDDWKMERVVEATAGYIIDLSDRWDISTEQLGERPVEVRVVDDRGSVSEDGIELSDPDLYRAVMRSNYTDRRVHDAVDRDYPVQFHQVPEEVGQLIGDRASNGWEFEGGFDSIARDELHGDLAKMEYFPWFVELEKDTWFRDLALLEEMNGESEIERIQEVQDVLTEEDGIYTEDLSGALDYALDEAPTDELVSLYNTKYENSPQPLSRNFISAYAAETEGDRFDDSDDWADEFVSLGEDELEEVRDRSLEYDSRADRAYLAAARVADTVRESEELEPRDVVASDRKTSRYIRKRLEEQDSRIRSQIGL